ncbi:MAG: MarR family transcriptional regulator [Naasia sp.]
MTTTGSALQLDEQVCYALAVASRSVIALYRPLLEPLGMTHPQYLVMLALWESDRRTVGELAGALRLEAATLSPLLKRLETLGYVRRTRRETDERVVEITLTGAGSAIRADAETIPARIVERLGLPVERLESLREALKEIIQASG